MDSPDSVEFATGQPRYTTVRKIGECVLLLTPDGSTINFATLAVAREIATAILSVCDGPDLLDDPLAALGEAL